MTTERRPDLDPAAIAEARVIKNAFRHAGIHVKTEPEPDGGIAFMYQKGVLLVRDEDLNRVLAIVAPPETEILDPLYPDRFPPERPVREEGEEGSGESGPERGPGTPGSRGPGDRSYGVSPAGWSGSRCSAAALTTTTTATMTRSRRTNRARPACFRP